MKPLCVTIQMKAIERYFHVALFIMLYKVVLTFKFVDKTLARPFKLKLLGSTFMHMVLFIMLYKLTPTFDIIWGWFSPNYCVTGEQLNGGLSL